MAKTRQMRHEAEHKSHNEFVKKVQAAQAVHAGREPRLSEKSMEFSSYMCNNGEHAQELAREITVGLDKVAFPVK